MSVTDAVPSPRRRRIRSRTGWPTTSSAPLTPVISVILLHGGYRRPIEASMWRSSQALELGLEPVPLTVAERRDGRGRRIAASPPHQGERHGREGTAAGDERHDVRRRVEATPSGLGEHGGTELADERGLDLVLRTARRDLPRDEGALAPGLRRLAREP